MLLIVGLGNPGKKYQNTRHNAGFLALEKFHAEAGREFSAWKKSKKFQVLISESADKKIKLALPQTFMNNSGEAVAALAKFYKIPPANVWIVHDDLDIPAGKIKIQINRSAAGHNGVKSIMEKLGSQNFARFRIGIKPAANIKKTGANLVLKKITKAEEPLLQKSLCATIEALAEALANGLEKTMNKYNA